MLVFVSVLGLITSLEQRNEPILSPIPSFQDQFCPNTHRHARPFLGHSSVSGEMGWLLRRGDRGRGLWLLQGENHRAPTKMCFHGVAGHLKGPLQANSFRCLVLEMNMLTGREVAKVTHR